jgi:hypothetical protein
MDLVELLKTVGLEMPTPAYLLGVLLFGIVGAVAWWHGKKTQRPTAKWLGLALMLYPYAVPQTWLLYLVGAALCIWLAFSWR